MPFTNQARDMFADAIIGGSSYTKFGSGAYVGVGNGTTAFAATQTDLQGSSRLRKQVLSGYPTRSGNVLTWQAQFDTSEANFAWEEAGVFNAQTGGQMLARKTQSMGTKSAGTVWLLSYHITIGVA